MITYWINLMILDELRGVFSAMAIIYKCRHCHHEIGKITNQIVSSSMLGLDQLSNEEKQKMVQFKANGDMHILSIYENCETSLFINPTLSNLTFFFYF